MGFTHKPTIKRTQRSDVFGNIKDVPVGTTFENRLFLHHSSVHTGILAGISGHKDEGCYSVVLSGGYEDDKDEGYQFTYTGCGGRDKKDGEKPRMGPQTCDQTWNPRNQSLRVSSYTRKPVRVVRGYNLHSDFAPVAGYRYDGLYVVESAWMETGKSGFKVCKYRLKRLPDQPPIPRREGTLNLKLSRWKKRGRSERDSADSSDAPAPGPSKRAKISKGKEVDRRKAPHPPRPSPLKGEVDNRHASHPVVHAVEYPRRVQPIVREAQAPTSAPSLDVKAILAEMHSKGPFRQ